MSPKRDRCQAALGGCPGLAGTEHGGRDSLDRRHRDNPLPLANSADGRSPGQAHHRDHRATKGPRHRGYKGLEVRPKRVALWMPLPGGKIADVSIQRCGPAGIAEAVVYRLSERLRQHKDIQFLGNLNILEAIVINGRVVIPDKISNDLDLLLWYGEVGRKHGTFAMEILKAFASEGVQLIPDLGPFSTALDKHRSHACLRRAGLPVAETLLFDRGALVYAAKILQEWGKAVLKPRLGAFGKGVTLIEDPNVLRDFMDYIYSWKRAQPRQWFFP